MTIEEQLKNIILERHKSVRAFTQEVDIPYSTMDTIFKRGIGGTGVNTVIKIFKALNLDVESITADELKSCKTKKAPTEQLGESDFQKKKLIYNYDKLNQTGKDKLLEYSDDLNCNPKYTDSDVEGSSQKHA